MKRIILFPILFLIIAFNSLAQVPPQSFNYQAVVRNNDSTLGSTNVSLQFTIREGSASGTVVYQETQSGLQTNIWGLVTAQIGGGIPTGLGSTPTFGSINWSTPKYVGVGIDITNGSNYTALGNPTQLVSVPYALYAAKSDTAVYAISAPQTVFHQGSGITISGDTIYNSAVGQVYSAGSGISISNDSIYNAITITHGAGISVSGTYPNFTITNTIPSPTISLNSTGDSLTISGGNSISTSLLVPPGTINAYGGNTAPAGWLLCDGGSYLNASSGLYANLYAAIGNNFGGSGISFNVPDLRGRFLRGVNGSTANNAGVTASNDPDIALRTPNGNNLTNAPGSTQSDTLKSHTHGVPGAVISYAGGSTPNANVLTGGGSLVENVSNSGGSETRPKNVYVNYIIKY
jgi:hypothetical protein